MGFKQQLIAEVRRRPGIWNTKCEEYKNRLFTDQHWDAIARKLYRTKSDVKTTWRNLRDVYKRELRRAGLRGRGAGPAPPYGGKWVFFRHMAFLHEAAFEAELQPKREASEPPESPEAYPPPPEPYEPAESPDLLFFKSLVPFLECLGPLQRLRLRSRIQDLVAEELGGGGGGGVPRRPPAM